MFWIWVLAVLSPTVFVLFDALLHLHLAGAWLYAELVVALAFSIIVVVVARHSLRAKIGFSFASVCLVGLQMLLLGAFFIAASGLEGTQ